jgi:LacI family transcriptional regulator
VLEVYLTAADLEHINKDMKRIPKVAIFFETSAVNDRRITRGIIKYAVLCGPWLFYSKMHPFYMTQGKDAWHKRILPELKVWRPDGIIAHVDAKRAKELLDFGVPTILQPLTEPMSMGSSTLRDDNRTTAKKGVEYLLDLGFKNYAFCGFANIYWSDERSAAFVKRIEQAGFEPHVYKPPRSRHRSFVEEDRTFLSEWLKRLPKPVAVMACNDIRGREVIDASRLADLVVPDEVAVLGVDDDNLVCDVTNPPLSSVSLNTEKAGYEAAKMLDKMMSNRKSKPKDITVSPTHVVARQSTDTLAIEDLEVVKAIRFIRAFRSREIGVNDVVATTTLARRALEQRFKKLLKRSIYREIRRVHVEQVAQMLLETTTPVYQIALSLGYSSSEHIARPFRKEKGMNPQEYRRRYSR